MKIKLLALMLSGAMASNAMATGIPVVDVGAIAQAVTQVKQQIDQINEAKNQVRAITGNAGLGNLINDPNIRAQLNKYLPKGYTDIYQAVKNGDLGALQSVYNKALADEKANNDAQNGKERLASAMVLNKAQMDGMLMQLDQRSQNLQSLVNQINSTTDATSKADLANTLSAQQAMINLDLNKMNVLMKQAELQERMAEKQAGAESRKKLVGQRYTSAK